MEKHLRAIRRHHAARIKAATRRWGERVVFKLRTFDFNRDPAWRDWTQEEKDRWVQRTWQNPKVCSCEMCCNPRRGRWHKKDRLTLAERRVVIE